MSEPVAEEVKETSLSLVSASSLEAVETRLNEFRAFVHRVLKKGIDYGTIPGTDKPTLLKPGAERILQLYGLTPIVVMDAAVEDFHGNPPLIAYRVKIQLLHRRSGEVIGEGVGACNSMEKKYRYRSEWWKDKKTAPPEGQGWVRKNGAYGAGYVRQIPNPDIGDSVNTILKIAKKRALIDAALTAGAASEFFTQDLDDLPVDESKLRRKSVPSKEAVIEETEHVEDPDEALFEDLAQSIIFVELKKAIAAGFNSATHRDNWLKKHKGEIDVLPEAAKDKLRQLYLHAEVKGGGRPESRTPAGPVGGAAEGAHSRPHPPAAADGGPKEAGEGEGEGGVAPGPDDGSTKGAARLAARDQVIRLADSVPGSEGET